MARRSEQKTQNKEPEQQPGLFGRSSQEWLDGTVHVLSRFLRYGWDLLGVVLFSVALIILFGTLGVTQGSFVTPLTAFLTRWLGLGRFILVILLVYIGYQVVRWRKHPPESIAIWRILSFEFAAFLFLAFLSLTASGTITEAEVGLDPGGIVGWGISEVFRVLFGGVGGGIILSLSLLISLIIAFKIFPKVERWVQSRMSHIPLQPLVEDQENPAPSSVIAKPEPLEEDQQPKSQQTVWIPPEFRKSFDPPDFADERPENPPERPKKLPPLEILKVGESYKPDKRSINMTAGLIEKTLDEFGIPAKVVGFRTGPTVTQFAVEPGYIDKSDDDRQKIRVSQISSLSRDLALALSAERLRIEAPVPGKSYVGIEIPNPNASNVRMRSILESELFYRVNSPLALALGRDVSGRPVVSDLTTMPHLLIAGTTGSGKSVCITSLTACLVMNNSPEELKLAMIDPKRVELMRFNDLPHLMGSVETEIERILGVLRWATAEMDFRYKLLEQARARNIDSYNRKMERQNKPKLPKIVIMIDELADLMMTAPDQTEHALVRLAQKARAIGIHLVVATQRPSTDVVTGLIKANFPTRISFNVATSIDSRVILDTGGAETLLGKGDMLFLHPEIGLPLRAQGVLVSDQELKRIIQWWKKFEKDEGTSTRPRYDDEESPPWEESIGQEETDEDEALIQEAIAIIKSEGHASASYFQRQLRVGYPRAARLVDQLEEMGILGPSQGGGREREILIDVDGDEDQE